MKVKNVESYLTELKKLDENFNSTAETLNEITNKFCVSSLFDEIIDDETWISQIASKSYHHNNGFEKLTVFSGSNYNLRIHIYWNNIKQSKPNIHDHRWNFSSKILSGGYISELYEIVDKGIEKQMYLYYSQEKLDGKYSLYNKGKVFLKKLKLGNTINPM
ncbi:hypothetical protein P8625_13235 [Tenacibaculum tangerinum]|uniref:Cysteine dioxygenase n=1 Tax=Tenacibaculum tangerinum TaxID=3038772 RepID=A0ABY8L0N1_9FLAO|nr:hypothetical protein [Tenacibaculum tangerinum]WGH75027.1 hypothetical protein P8625_13235 [Tenacibaculum tangerinum]